MQDTCYVYGTIPATPGYENCPGIGFIAHMDTSPDFCGEHVNPQIHENYDGKDLEIGNGKILTLDKFPHLADWTHPDYNGRDHASWRR